MKKIVVYIFRVSGALLKAVAEVEGQAIEEAHHDERALRFKMSKRLKGLGVEEVEFEVDDSAYVVKIIGLASGARTSSDGQYLKSFDPKAAGGRGFLETTPKLERARVFTSKAVILELWKKSSLKAFTIDIQPKEVKK